MAGDVYGWVAIMTESLSREGQWARFRSILADRLDVPDARIVREATFTGDLGADSLGMTELIMDLEDAFGITISQAEAVALRTVGEAFDFRRSDPVERGMSRIVVTGMGALSPLGHTAHSSFEALVAGHCGIATASIPLDDGVESRIAGQVSGLDMAARIGVKESRRYARYTQLALAAGREALDHAGWSGTAYTPARVACIVGVGLGGLEALEDAVEIRMTRGSRRVSPFGVQALIPNMAAGALSQLANAQGPCWCVSTACASGAHAIGHAMHLIRSGQVDAAICGGAEACVTPVALACFSRMGALSTRNADPLRASRPFDRGRDGFVIAEGAAILVLEREDGARRRGASIHGCVCGFGATADAFDATHPAPDGKGAKVAMQNALEDAGVSGDQVDYVNAHGTGTKINDAIEARAIRDAFGGHSKDLLVSSTKGATGHMLGAAGAFEAVVSLLTIRSGRVPPTLNLDTPDDGCGLDLVPRTSREAHVRYVVSNSFGFGGQNASLVLGNA